MTTTAVEPVPTTQQTGASVPRISGGPEAATSSTLLVIAHVVPAAVAGAVTFKWFQRGQFVAAGDVAPFIRDGLMAELPSSWGHQLTGAGSASYEIARVLDVGALQVARTLGWSEPAAQQLLYAVLFAAAAASGALLASALTRRPSAILMGGLLAVFNPFVMLHLPNPLPVVTIAVIAATGGLALRRARNAPVRATTLALATIPVSYLAVNPPTVAVTAVWMSMLVPLGALLAGGAGGRRVGVLLLRAAPIAVVLNAWWIVPTAQTVIGGDGPSIQAETDAAQWEWSHAENSVPNVATLTAHWGWDQPGYYPYARTLDGGVWPVLRWALPATALGGVLLAHRRHRRLAVGLAILAVAAIALAKGVHPPGGGINRWLYDHVPGLWLLREPVGKLGPLISVGYAALAVLAVDGMLSKAAGAHPRARQCAGATAACVVAAALVHPFPLWTGDVMPTDRDPLPSAHVAVPKGWRDLAGTVNGSPHHGKVLVLPLNRYYQSTTSWGYHGVDTLAHQLLARPVIQRLPGGYFSGDATFVHLVESVQSGLRAADTDAVPRLLDALGVTHVVLRRDLTSNASGRPAPSVDDLGTALAATPQLRLVGRYGVADLYEKAPAAGMVAAGRSGVRIVGRVDQSAAALSALASDAIGIPGDRPTDGVALELPADTRAQFALRTAGVYRVVHRLRAEALYQVSHRGGESAVTIRPASRVRLDGSLLPAPIAVARVAPRTAAAIETAGRFQPLERGTTLIAAPAATDAVIWSRRGTERIRTLSPLEDCNAHDRRRPDEAGLRLTRPAPGITQLEAAAHSACVSVAFGNPLAPAYRVTVEHRVRSGRFARLCIWQHGPNRCADLPAPISGSEWRTYSTAFRPAPGTTGLRLHLYADGGGAEPTVIQYRTPTVEALHPAATVTLPGPDSWSTTRALDRGPHTIEGSTEGLRSELGPFSAVQDCHATRDTAGSAAHLTAIRDGPIIRLSASAHSACVSAPVTGDGASRLYRVRLEHRTLRGRPARICMWEDTPRRCSDLPPLPRSSGWAAYETTLRADPATNRLDLYLYADGTDGGTTVEYRSVTVEPVASSVLVLVPAAGPGHQPPELSYSRHGADRYTVRVRDASGPFVVRLADAFAKGWTLSGLPPGWTADHVRADAYANGWLVSGSGSATLLLAYAPSSQARAALGLSLLSGAVIAVLGARRRWQRRQTGASRTPATASTPKSEEA